MNIALVATGPSISGLRIPRTRPDESNQTGLPEGDLGSMASVTSASWLLE